MWRENRRKRIAEIIFFWGFGGTVYYLLETAVRGFSHWSMFLLGGAALVFCTFQGIAMEWTEPLWIQIGRGTLFVLALEFTTGIIVNKIFRLEVWDYSDQPFQIWGQICLPFAILFSGLVTAAILTGGALSYILFGEKKPNFFIL